MKKFILSLMVLGLVVTSAHAGLLGGASPVVNAGGSTSIAVGTDESIYTTSFSLNHSYVFGVWAQAVSTSGTPDISIELEESYTLPATEGAADVNYAEPEDFDDVFASITDENAHIDVLAPVPMTYARYKITGNAGNPSDTIVTMFNFMQGE